MYHRERLREQLSSSDLAVSFVVADGIGAHVVEGMGFDTVMVGGGATSNSRLAKPDYGFLNLTDNVDHLRAIAREVDLAVQADADTGYGNALHVHDAVRRFEAAGAASVMIEDQDAPKRCGHMAGKTVIPREEMMQKVRAAVRARRDPDLVVMARTDAATPHDVDEAIGRLNAYADAGADLAFADALASEADIRRVAREVDLPVAVNMGYGLRPRGTTPLVSPKDLEAAGVAMVLYGRLVTGAAVRGIQNALEAVRESHETGRLVERPDLTVGFDEYVELMGLPSLQALEEAFASASE